MALAANTANVVILEDSHTRTTAKLWYHLNSGSNGEVDVLKVNAASLKGACMDLTINVAQYNTISGMYKFVPGEKITANGGSAAVGYVATWTPSTTANSTLRVVLADPTIAFANGDAIIGGRLGTSVTAVTATRPWYQLTIESIWHSITGKNGEAVGLEFAGANSSVFSTAVLLHGENYHGKNSTIATKISNPKDSATDPNIYVSAYNFAALSSYTLILELGKADGYGMPVEG